MIETLENIEVVEGTCGFCDYYCHCGTKDWLLCKALIGKGNIFKKKETWVPCTKENTKVGDVVVCPEDSTKNTVKYIDDEHDIFLLVEQGNSFGLSSFYLEYMEDFKIKVKLGAGGY